MLENCRNAKERWGGVSDLIDRWLKERQELLVHYCDVSDTARISAPSALRGALEHLCEVLVDYVSAGHFEVYEQLIQEAREFDDGGAELAEKIYPKITETTGVVLDFNERLDGGPETRSQEELMAELSRLGESLETRFELEDFLIEHLHNVHGGRVMSSA
ncbi:sigma D regulator [uncultured Marinobacter sp.]|uniref:sigma D regulator n=1 Tax=uncultured Marinobacter sp. TaxID=187379 RepID=UPI0030DCA01C